MKASDYRDLLRRKNESGVFDATAHTENPAVKKAWDDFNAHTVKLGAGYRLYTDIQAFLSTRKIAVRDEKFAHKLAAFLSKPEAAQHHLPKLTFGDIALLFAQNGVPSSSVETAAEFFKYLNEVPPITHEQHVALIEAQKQAMGVRIERTGRNRFTETVKQKLLRPLFTSSPLVEARLAQEEAYRRQNFLPDGRPAGIQHIFAEQAAKSSAGGTIPIMTGEHPTQEGTGGLDAADVSAKRENLIASARELLSKLDSDTPPNQSELEQLQRIAIKDVNNFMGVAASVVDTHDGGLSFIFDGQPITEVLITQAQKEKIRALSHSESSERAANAQSEFNALVTAARDDARVPQIQFKHLQQLVRLCSSGSTVEFAYLHDESPYAFDSSESFTKGRNFTMDGVVIGSLSAADIERFPKLLVQEFEKRVEAEAFKISGGKAEEVQAIRGILQSADWSPHVISAGNGASIEAPLQAALQSLKTTNSTDVQDMQTYRALTALAAGLGYTHLSGLFAPAFGEKTEAHAHRPRVLNKILVEGKKYKDAAEKQYVAGLLALTDGADKVWGTSTLKIETEATTGTKVYTYAGRDGVERTFTLTSEEQAKLKDAGLETGSEKEVEGMRLAISEIQNRLSKIERDSAVDGLDPEKKAKNAQYIDLLLKEELTFPGVYYVRDTKKPKPGERAKDKRVKVSFLKNVSADAVTISGGPVDGYDGPIPNIIIEKAKLVALKAKLEGKKTEDPKKPADLDAALGVLSTWDKTKYFDNDAQRAVLDKYLKPLVDSAHRPAKIGDFDIADAAHSFKFSKDGKPAFTIAASQVALWRDISAVPKPPEPPRLPPSDALPAGALESSVVGEPGWEDELGRRIGTKLLLSRVPGSKQEEISREKALNYVKELSFGKRMWLYAKLALGTAAAGLAAATAFSLLLPLATTGLPLWGWVLSKMAFGAASAIGMNIFLTKKWLDKKYGLSGKDGTPQISFFERSKDAAGYYKALKVFRKKQSAFLDNENRVIAARNAIRPDGHEAFKAGTYSMGMSEIMALHEIGARREKWWRIGTSVFTGAALTGGTIAAIDTISVMRGGNANHLNALKNGWASLMPGSRPPTGQAAVPPVGSRGPVQLPPGGRQPVPPQSGPRFVQDRFGRWILPNSGQYIEVYCGAPRATCIPCDFTINGTRAHWYINSFADSMSVASPKGGMSHLLGNMNTIPGGRATQEQVWSLFERTLCADRDLYRTFYNVGNSSKGRWIDFAVLKETTWIGGRKQTMIDVMIDRAGNENVRSTLRAMRESIIQNNPRLSVRLAR